MSETGLHLVRTTACGRYAVTLTGPDTVQPIREAAGICRELLAILHDLEDGISHYVTGLDPPAGLPTAPIPLLRLVHSRDDATDDRPT